MMRNFKAFTLIETLVVIVVFCIGILVVLQGLSQTLRNKDYANTQIKSAFFAHEGIELVFNMRDANYHKELPWNCIFQGLSELTEDGCKENLEPGKILTISIGNENDYVNVKVSPISIGDLTDDETFDKVFEQYQLYKHIDNSFFVFNHDPNDGEATGFARYLEIKAVDSEEGKLDENKLLKIESHVLYKRGIFKGEKVMETFIGNYKFNQ